MYDFKLTDGAEKQWFDESGKLVAVIRGVKKRTRKGRSTKSHTVARILRPDEFEAEKLTRNTGKR